MEYTGKYIQVSREQLLADLQQQIKAKRYQHVLRVEQTALALAKIYGVDTEAVSIVALGHDYAKEMALADMRQLAQTYWPSVDLRQASDNILHGPAAAQILKQDYGCTDPSLLEAIAGHTIGNFKMDMLAKILYVADYIEPGRVFPGVEAVRAIAQEDLDAACWAEMTATLNHLIEQRAYIFPMTLAIYNEWVLQGI